MNSQFSRDIANVLHPYTNLKTHLQRGPLVIKRGDGICSEITKLDRFWLEFFRGNSLAGRSGEQ